MNVTEIDELLRAKLMVILTNDEIATLVADHGLAAPLLAGRAFAAASVTDEARRSLADHGMIANGRPDDWFASCWHTITRPDAVVMLDRQVDDRIYSWVYLLGPGTFAAQTASDAGLAWAFGSYLDLLPQVLVAAGLLRTLGPTYDVLPWATAWTTSITCQSRVLPDGKPVDRSLLLHGPAWTEERDGVATPVTQHDAVALVAQQLGVDLASLG